MPHPARATWSPARRSLAVLAAAGLAAACGGGGDDDNGTDLTASSAEGFYVGSVAGGTTNYFEKLVLENNEVWLLYGNRASPSAGFAATGLISGPAAFSSGTLSSSTVRDFGSTPTATVSLNAAYKINSRSGAKTVAGSVSLGSTALSFSGDNRISNYLYSLPASASDVAGAWTMASVSTPRTLTVSAAGGFTLNVGGCTAVGTITPRPSGKNVFNVALTFGAPPCAQAGVAFSGVAIVSDGTLPTSRDLRIAVRNGAQTVGLLLAASR